MIFLYCFDFQSFFSDHLSNLFLIIVLITFSNHSNLAFVCCFRSICFFFSKILPNAFFQIQFFFLV